MNRLSPIFTSITSTETMGEIARLGDLYRATQRKSLSSNLLHFASWGMGRNTLYGITLTWEIGQEDEANWIRQNVKESAVVA